MSSKSRNLLKRIPLYAFLILGSVGMLVPFVWMILSALKPNNEIFTSPPTFLPKDPNWGNFVEAWGSGDFTQYFINTSIISVLTTVITLFICSLAGYTFAKFNFMGKKVLFLLFLGTMMIPMQVIMIPIFLMMSKIGLLNSYWSVILPLVANAYGVFLMRQFMSTIPTELMEAARIDGCSEFRIFWQIILPLTKPALVTLGILTFLGAWNEFLWPLIMLDSPDMMTLQVALTQFQGQYEVKWNLLMAASALSMIPIALIFIVFQRYLVEGIASSGVKG
ncbi:carbohydrate ABC transporter permease [Aeromicrobium ponti]|uniref:Multiple sugar transport system permease protein/alpha-1,4-digalacturonate transport system permease protein n=1 Tax=Cytobacillus oceanisediminis TaxID=665099 RepID=A0A562J7L4_9BACI|nr:carbohydrate ABC transporter permease [Cytobacillus oceanisediminis]TWH78895.1 multiple sugar transport system permease protein/alpha-1,4-digalacturonate transport system permease protein [Cytobacillus oceanisediminis]